jgi:hypothetical protein
MKDAHRERFTELGFHLAPTHGALVDKLGGHMDGFPQLPYRVWLDQAERIWQALSSEEMPFPADVTAMIGRSARYLRNGSQDFVNTVSAAGALGKLTPEELRLCYQAREDQLEIAVLYRELIQRDVADVQIEARRELSQKERVAFPSRRRCRALLIAVASYARRWKA